MAYVLVAAIVGGGIAFLVFLRQLHRTFSRRGREQLDSLGPLLGPPHPLWPTKEMRAPHRGHRIVPVLFRRPNRSMTHTDQGHLVARVIARRAEPVPAAPLPTRKCPAWTG